MYRVNKQLATADFAPSSAGCSINVFPKKVHICVGQLFLGLHFLGKRSKSQESNQGMTSPSSLHSKLNAICKPARALIRDLSNSLAELLSKSSSISSCSSMMLLMLVPFSQ